MDNRHARYFLQRFSATPTQIVDMLEDLLNHHSATAASRSSALTALAKVSYRLRGVLGEEGTFRVERLLKGYRSSITLELQQRWASPPANQRAGCAREDRSRRAPQEPKCRCCGCG